MKQLHLLALLTLTFAWPLSALAQRSQQTAPYSIRMSAAVQREPAQIALHWPKSDAKTYVVYRRFMGQTRWNPAPVAVLPGDAVGYPDTHVQVGVLYEYRVDKFTSTLVGRSYLCSGIQVPPTLDRGGVLLMVEQDIAKALPLELARLERDLRSDGWSVIRQVVGRHDKVTQVKQLIVQAYQRDPEHLKTVFLLGHIPVPYSGSLAPDGHTNHLGAWPADVYYADVDGDWPDTQNHKFYPRGNQANVAGDGKFDLSTIEPDSLELEVGRVDLANMPAFALSEVELIQQYLNKNHFFRHALLPARPQGLIDDNFGAFRGEAFGSSAWSNFSAFFGVDNIVDQDWFTVLPDTAYLWAYGCGGGSDTHAGGVGSTQDFVDRDPKAIFTLLFGSYFGDWNRTNSFLRAPLATSSYGLTCAWDGRPHWYFHHMAMGKNIGYSALRTQANNHFGDYLPCDNIRATLSGQDDDSEWDFNPVHVALMGDPTLRMHPTAPVKKLSASRQSDDIQLTWEPGAEALSGQSYWVYRAATFDGPFENLTDQPIEKPAYLDTRWPGTAVVYMVKSAVLQTSASGSYVNTSQGKYLAVLQTGLVAPPLTVSMPHDIVTTQEDHPVSLPTPQPDRPDETLLYSVIQHPGHGTVKQDDAKEHFIYQPSPDYVGPDAFAYVASNCRGQETQPMLVRLDVTSVEDQPIALPQRVEMSGSPTRAFTLKAVDMDNDPLTYRIIEFPQEGTLTGEPPELVYTAKPHSTALACTLSFMVNDGKADSLPATVTLQFPRPCLATPTPKVIDAKLEDWGPLAFSCTDPEQIKHLGKGSWGGPQDSQFTFDVAYDQAFVYVAVQVLDQEIVAEQGRDPWEQDGIEIRFDARPSDIRGVNSGKGETKDFLLLALSPSASPDDAWLYRTKIPLPEGSRYACVRNAKGFITEIAIPVAYLNTMADQPWQGFRLNIAVDDMDHNRFNQIWWTPDWRTEKTYPYSGTFQRR